LTAKSDGIRFYRVTAQQGNGCRSRVQPAAHANPHSMYQTVGTPHLAFEMWVHELPSFAPTRPHEPPPRQGPKARRIPAWGRSPGSPAPTDPGARPLRSAETSPSIPAQSDTVAKARSKLRPRFHRPLQSVMHPSRNGRNRQTVWATHPSARRRVQQFYRPELSGGFPKRCQAP
jgi:hypothetical protein